MEAQRFAALRIPPYRRYFLANLLSMTADNIEHVISYWVIFQVFHSPALAGSAVISHFSLELASLMVVLTAVALFAFDSRNRSQRTAPVVVSERNPG